MLAAYVAIVAPSLGQSLVENHAYRQTQTAYTAVLFAEHGVDFMRPPLPVLGVPGVVPQEFPLFQAVGALLIGAGAPPDLAMRITGLACFLVSAVLLFLLARHLLNETGALIALAAFLFNPHAWVYGRTSLIEYLATAGGIGFLLFALRWLDGRRRRDWVVALVGAAVALTVKITTGPLYLLPALAWRSSSGEWGFRRPSLWILIGLSFGVGLAWNGYADAIRAANPGTEFLAAKNQSDWFFGTIEQRLDIGSWRVPLLSVLALSGSGLVVWAIFATRFANRHAQRPFLLSLLIAIALPPLILFNLYAVHEYYFVALAPLIALAIAMGAQELLTNLRSKINRRVLVGLGGAWLATLVGMSSSWSLIYGTPREEARVLQAAAYIREHSSPTDWVVVDGFGWNSTFLYYARRQGYAVPGTDNLLDPGELDLDAILADPIYGPFFTCDAAANCTVSDSR
jgi:4-amino-4-deoxy-L-arabinose transferase-like glycosyltransferase